MVAVDGVRRGKINAILIYRLGDGIASVVTGNVLETRLDRHPSMTVNLLSGPQIQL